MNFSGKIARTAASLLASAGIISGLSACGTPENATDTTTDLSHTYSDMLEEGVFRAIDREGKIFYFPKDGYDVVDVYKEPIPRETAQQFMKLNAIQHPYPMQTAPFTWKKDPETEGLYLTDGFNRQVYREDGSPYHIVDTRSRDFRLTISDIGLSETSICRTEFSNGSVKRFTAPKTTCRKVTDVFDTGDPAEYHIKHLLEYHDHLHPS